MSRVIADGLSERGKLNSAVASHGITESVTLSTGTLTIPVGMSTIKLPSTVWDGSSNITISGFAFENGVQPEPGYEFALVIPRTGVASAGTLGNEVLLQHGASLQVSANGFADLPCYPNAADNPDQDAVQYAAPYYRLKMRVESYDGSGDPVVSVEELPGRAKISNDAGGSVIYPDGGGEVLIKTVLPYVSSSRLESSGLQLPVVLAQVDSAHISNRDEASGTSASFSGLTGFYTLDIFSGGSTGRIGYNSTGTPFNSGDQMAIYLSAKGSWY